MTMWVHTFQGQRVDGRVGGLHRFHVVFEDIHGVANVQNTSLLRDNGTQLLCKETKRRTRKKGKNRRAWTWLTAQRSHILF